MHSLDAAAQTTILAALLHDIGKFAQRARVPLDERNRSLDRTDYGEHGAHALHSVQFVDEELAPHLRGCRAPILYHHRKDPPDLTARIIATADHLSAAERWANSTEDDPRAPLANVLATVFADGARAAAPGCFALRRLNPADAASCFPTTPDWDRRSQEQGYAALWRAFVTAHRQLDQSDFARYLAGLYSLLQEYTWCVPSAAYHARPDISLFDHARTTAAIAAALRATLAERGALADDVDPSQAAGHACFLLVRGDLSGIQSHLYDIANVGVGGVARRLRARSLYLQLVSEVAAQQVLAALGLPFLNALMLSGGHFDLLVPNTKTVRRALATVQTEADRWLLGRFGGELVLNLASVELGVADFETDKERSGFGEVLRRAGEALARRKQVPLREALQTGGRWDEDAFLLPGFAGEQACESCAKRPRAPGSELCPGCQADWEVGRLLPDAYCLALYPGRRAGAMHVLGHSVEVIPQGRGVEGDPYLVLALGQFDPRLASQAPLLTRPICNYVPTWSTGELQSSPAVESEDAWPGAPVTFEKLAGRAQGRPLLGFLKADVDWLGEAFVHGLKPGRDTPSRLAQMSRMLDLFFGGWLPHLLSSRFRDCYSVYAGGDDLLLVGPWDQVLELATALRADFARLTQNPELHLSAGVFVAKPGYPVARAAAHADDALRLAKQAGRNSLSALGHTLTWERWELVRGRWRELEGEARDVASAFLYHLLTYARLWRRYAGKGDVLGLRYQPLLAYDVGRNLDRAKSPGLFAFATDLLSLRPGDADQEVILDNLGLLAQLWILGRGEGDEQSV